MKNLEEVYDDRYQGDYRASISGYEIARCKALADFIPQKIDAQAPLKILDYGSGSGMHIHFWKSLFPKAQLYFCDISRVALEKLAQKHPEYAENIAVFKDSKAQFDDHQFDVVISIEVMEHVENLPAYLQDIRRLLKPGGSFIWTTPCGNPYSIEHIYNVFTQQIEKTSEGYRRWKWEDPTHIRRLKTSEIEQILLQQGYRDVDFRFRSHLFSFVCTRLFRGPLRRMGEKLMPLDYTLFGKWPNGASMIGFARS